MYTVNEVVKKVNKEFIDYFMLSREKHNLSPTTNILQDLTLDSLDHVGLVMAIEEQFDIRATDQEASHCITIGDVYRLVANKLAVEYTYEVGNKQPKEKNMTTLKLEGLINTKWDARNWTQEMKIRWQEKMFELGIKWYDVYRVNTKIQELRRDYYFIDTKGLLYYGENRQSFDSCPELTTAYYEDIFPQDKVQRVATVSGSGVHAESGSVNDTRKDVADKNTSALDTLRNVCQEHGLYMTFDPHGEVIVTEESYDVEYKVNSEDQFQKLLSALEVLYSYVKH